MAGKRAPGSGWLRRLAVYCWRDRKDVVFALAGAIAGLAGALYAATVRTAGPDRFSVVETVKTELGAKTMGLDTKTHRLFVDTADFGPAPAPTPGHPHPRPTAIPGTFHVLVYGR